MLRPTFCIAALLAGLVFLQGCAQSAKTLQPAADDAERVPTHDRLDWWREARFGMFIHWGLYSVPAGEWGDRKDHAEWIRDTAQIPLKQYESFASQFNPGKFNAEAWVALAKAAGANYIVVTTKHHDGFCLFDSKYTDWDVMVTPFHRDIMGELSQACRKAGIRVCWYYSIMDWHHPDYLPRRPWERVERPVVGADYARYLAYMKNQLRELLTHYGPVGIMWFDGQWEGTWSDELGREIESYVRSLQPDTIINSRVGRSGGFYGLNRSEGSLGDYGTPEQFIPDAAIPGFDWETCMTINDHWGYNKNDDHWKSESELIRKLIDIASKGGNLLLNVGPTAEGVIPEPCIERMQAMGEWLKKNGESIYGTVGGPFRHTKTWWRCTMRSLPGGDTRLYLHIFDAPSGGRLTLIRILNKPKQAYLLAEGPSATVDVRRNGDDIEVTLPSLTGRGAAFAGAAYVIALDLEGRPDIGDPPVISADYPLFTDSLDVAFHSGQSGVDVRCTSDGAEPDSKSPIAGGPLKISKTTTLRARAFRGERPVSALSAATVTRVQPRPTVSLDDPLPGLDCDYFEGQFSTVSDFETVQPTAGASANGFSNTLARRDDLWALRFRGFVKVPGTGPYRFFVRSDDGSRLWIDDELVVDNDGPHSSLEKSGVVALQVGYHAIRVDMFEQTGGSELVVSWEAPGIAKQEIPPDALWRGR